MPIIYISNSCLDGFREGDGDLMDKIMIQLQRIATKTGIIVRRIVVNPFNIPANRRCADIIPLAIVAGITPSLLAQFESGKHITPKKMLEVIRSLQDGFLKIIREDVRDTQKILYLGSRFDTVFHVSATTSSLPIFGGSGSLFTQSFLRDLKSQGIKIVVCCLEYKFFKRSLGDLEKAHEMFRQQLLLADRIQFLTESDEEDYCSTLGSLATNIRSRELAVLRPVPQLVVAHEESTKSSHLSDLTRDIEQFAHDLSLVNLQARTIFIPGIYTVDPLTDIAIMLSMPTHHARVPASSDAAVAVALGLPPADEADESKIINMLSSRPPNVLCFGLIRRNKGLGEAIDLMGEFSKWSEPRPKVIIAGKVMGSSFLYFRDIVVKACSLLSEPDDCAKEFDEIFRAEFKAYEERGEIGEGEAELRNINETSFKEGKSALNRFCSDILHAMPRYQALVAKHLEIHINPTEDELRGIAMQCRYAIKLDHKGMAHNASSIVSCLGFYLPTFTLCGLTTDSCFKNGGRYSYAVIMPKEEYFIHEGKEVRPRIPDDYIHIIANQITVETKELEEGRERSIYVGRLNCLRIMYKDGIFKSDSVTSQLLTKVLEPLLSEISVEMSQAASSSKKSGIEEHHNVQ